MSYRISKIELTFENLESILIDGENIEDIEMQVTAAVSKIKAKEIDFCESVKYMMLKLSEKADTEYIGNPDNRCDTVFERIMKYRDISYVTLYIDEENIGGSTERMYTVPWEELHEENIRQRAVYEGGSLNVYIE